MIMKRLIRTTIILSGLLGSSISMPMQADELDTSKLDTYGGFIHIKAEKTGFFHAEKIDNRWWLVTPEGNAFWGIGMAHPITDFTRSAVTFTFGGDQEAWLRGSIQRMRDLGYNAVWSGPYSPERSRDGYVDKALAERVFAESNIPYVFPLPLIKHAVELKPGEKQPDVFSDTYIRHVNDLVANAVPKLKDDPWVMGYYYGFGSWDREISWINQTLSRPDSPGRQRLIAVLETRYQGNIATFNATYGQTFKSFTSLKKSGTLVYPNWIRSLKMGQGKMPKQSGSQAIFDDAQALLGEIITQVYRLGHEAIRSHDQNHMIFGAYVKEATLTMDIWKRVNPYIDVIAPQHVSKIFPIGKVVRALGKPALISDQPFGNVYPPHLIEKGGTSGAVPGHVDRLVLYDILANMISKNPNFIGVDFCSILFDQSHGVKAYGRGQPGFFSIDGEARSHLSRTVQNLNGQILNNVQAPHDMKAAKALDIKFHDTLQRLRQVVNDRKNLLKKNPAVIYPSGN